jgi:hypothetical protein
MQEIQESRPTTCAPRDPKEGGEGLQDKPVVSERSTARSLLKHLGTWVGDDGERCLHEVLAARGEAVFE